MNSRFPQLTDKDEPYLSASSDKMYHACHFKYALEKIIGIRPKETAPPLLIGQFTHAGHETLRAHFAKTGEWDLERALVAVEAKAVAAKDEAGTHWADDLALAKALIVAYRDWYGPGGAASEQPGDVEVVTDEHGPVVEREYRTVIADTFNWVCRIDMLAYWHGYLVVWEVKTVDARGIGGLESSIPWDTQFTGEVYTLAKNHPELPLAGVVADVMVKGRAARGSKVDPCYRFETSRTVEQLADWETGRLATFYAIRNVFVYYTQDVADGRDRFEALREYFPKTGMSNGSCRAFNRMCPYIEVCLNPGREHRIVETSFRARTPKEASLRTELGGDRGDNQ